jgi:hypothetical protein
MKFVILIVGFMILCCKIQENKAPDVEIVEIPDSVYVKDRVVIKAKAVDMEGDAVSVRVDYGDGIVSEFSPYFRSGSIISFEHTYTFRGDYWVRVQAKDDQENFSLWSGGNLLRVLILGQQ